MRELFEEILGEPPRTLREVSGRWGAWQPAGSDCVRISSPSLLGCSELTATLGPGDRIDLLELRLVPGFLRRDQLTSLGEPQRQRADKEGLIPLAFPCAGGMVFAFVSDDQAADAGVARLLLRRRSYLSGK